MSLTKGNVRHRLTLSYLAAFTVILLLFIVGAATLLYVQLTRQMVHAEVQDLETAEGLLYFSPLRQLILNERYHNHPRSRLLNDRYMEVLTLDGKVLLRNERLGKESLGGTPLADEGRTSYNERTQTLNDGTHLLLIAICIPYPLLIRVGYSAGGSGLGLSIVKGAVEANGGMISLVNVDDGGNTSAIRLPTT